MKTAEFDITSSGDAGIAAAGAPAVAAIPADVRGASLSHSIKDGSANAITMGVGEGYLSAYAVFLHSGSLFIGLLATLPQLVGSLSQLLMVHVMDRIRHRKRLVVIPTFVQGVGWLLLFAVPILSGDLGPLALVLCAVPCLALGSLIAPAWTSWIGDLVEPGRMGGFLGRRERIRTILQLVGLLSAGAVLHLARGQGQEALGFGIIFSLAFLARLLSVRHISLMHEPAYRPPEHVKTLTFAKFVRRTPIMNFGRFTRYVAAITAAMNVAGPFFALYMLRDLHFSYVEFTLVAAAGIVIQAVTMHKWGLLADRFGNRVILMATGSVIPFLPLLWLISPTFLAVLLVQAFSGVIRSGFTLATSSFVFDAVRPNMRPRAVAYYSIMVNGGAVFGALLGGLLGLYLPSGVLVAGYPIRFVSPLIPLFFTSFLLRLLVTLRYLPLVREVREVEKSDPLDIMFHVTGLNAVRGLRVWPIDIRGHATGEHPSPEGPSPGSGA